MTLCVVAIARHETRYLLEWVGYQRVIGADRVMIYDNGHDPAGQTLLDQLHRCGIITRVPWHGIHPHGPQVPAYDDALGRLRGASDWVLFVDLDEFVVPVKDDDLVQILDRAGELDGMWFPWVIFGSAGEQEYRPLPIIERFRLRQHVDDATVTPVKSAIRPHRATGAHLHVHHLGSDAYANPLGEREYLIASTGGRRSSQHARGFDLVRVHHYMTKSVAEWREKVARGRADRGPADPAPGRELTEFAQWDRNEVEDTTALRFLPDLYREMAVLQRLLERT